MNKIDIVITWVDSADPEWLLNFENTVKKETGSYVKSKLRFKDWGTLKYIFRMIEKHMPWINKVYLVTANQYPNWINLNYEKFELISHNQIFESQECLPTFNSTAIELSLCNITNLSENFIIWNDDFYLFKNMESKDFFENGLPVDDFKIRFRIPESLNFLRKTPLSSINVVKNSQLKAIEYIKKNNHIKSIAYRLLFYFFEIKIWHHPQPHSKHNFCALIDFFKSDTDLIKLSKVRPLVRFNQYLMRNVMLLTGKYSKRPSTTYKNSHSLFIDTHKDLVNAIEKIKNPKTTFLCLCETSTINESEFEKCSNDFIVFLKSKYPLKSNFEL
jgi:hypothetical protein